MLVNWKQIQAPSQSTSRAATSPLVVAAASSLAVQIDFCLSQTQVPEQTFICSKSILTLAKL